LLCKSPTESYSLLHHHIVVGLKQVLHARHKRIINERSSIHVTLKKRLFSFVRTEAQIRLNTQVQSLNDDRQANNQCICTADTPRDRCIQDMMCSCRGGCDSKRRKVALYGHHYKRGRFWSLLTNNRTNRNSRCSSTGRSWSFQYLLQVARIRCSFTSP